MNGYSIPKGTQIITNWNSVNHDPEIWPEPAVFKPERFLDENGKYKSRPEFAPFTQGKYKPDNELFLVCNSMIFNTGYPGMGNPVF